MPKQPGGISRLKRVEVLLDVLKRWGLLDKPSIDQKVAAVLGVDISVLERSLYRDLQQLVDNGSVIMFGRSSDGQFVQNMSHEENSNFKSFWCISSYSPHDIIGVEKLRQLEGDFFCDSILKDSFRIVEVPKNIEGFNGFIFNIGVQSLALAYDIDSHPFSLIITRSGIDISKALKEVQEELGIRVAFLALPIDKISSYKLPRSPGHALIKLEMPGRGIIKDLNSSNGSSFREVDSALGSSVVKCYTERMKTKKEKNLMENESKVLKAVTSESVSFSLPVEIYLANSFSCLIF